MAVKITKLSSGQWRGKCYAYTKDNGTRYYQYFTGDTKSDVSFQIAQFQKKKDRGEHTANITVREAIDSYIAEIGPSLSPATLHGYENIRENAFQDIMDTKLSKLSDSVLQKAINAESQRSVMRAHVKSPISAKTVKNEWGLVRSAIYRKDPVLHAIRLPKHAKKLRDLPDPAQLINIFRDTDMELPVLLAMWMSFTVSEIRGLTKSGSISGDYITINRVIVDVGGKDAVKDLAKNPKRNRRHQIPQRIQELIDEVEGDVLVPMSYRHIYDRFKTILKPYGIKMTFHDLRHVSASVMVLLSIPDKYAEDRGGWSSDSTMKRVYQETFTLERKKVDAKINHYFENAYKKKCATKCATTKKKPRSSAVS